MRLLAGPCGLRQLATTGRCTKFLACRNPWPQHPGQLARGPQLKPTCAASTASSSSSSSSASAAPPAKSSPGGAGAADDEEGGIRFVYEPPRRFVLAALRKRRQGPPTTAKPKVDLLVEGNPLARSPSRVDSLAEALEADAAAALRRVLERKGAQKAAEGWKMPRVACLSLVLCDDPHIRHLNSLHRGKDAPTDVLSFELGDELDYRVHLPVKLMGDLVVSLDTAERQARERGHSLLDECRILLVHGLLHLAGWDHERGEQEHEAMAAEERAVLAELGWRGAGLITAAEEAAAREEEQGQGQGSPAGAATAVAAGAGGAAPAKREEGGGDGKGKDGKKGAAATRGSKGIAAGPGAGLLWQQIAGGGEDGEEEEGPAARGSRKGKQGGAGASGGGGGKDRGAASAAAAAAPKAGGGGGGSKGQAGGRQAPQQQSQQQSQQQRRDSGGRSGGGGGGGGGGSGNGGRRGGATRAFATSSACASAAIAATSANCSSSYCVLGGCGSSTWGAGASLAPWRGSGLASGRSAGFATAATGASSSSSGGGSSTSTSTSTTSQAASPDSSSSLSGSSSSSSGSSTGRRRRSRDIAIVALDLDGTLLDSRSRILPCSVAAIRAAAAAGVTVVAATGKARPAALAAAAAAGLAEPGLLVWPQGPGVFLQGLAVHGRGGAMLSDAVLPAAVVRAAFDYAAATSTPLCAFLGDTCATTAGAGGLTPELVALHETYYEPLAQVYAGPEELLKAAAATGGVRKLLFMTDPASVSGRLIPHWEAALAGSGAETMQAVPNMLEVVPTGVNKWGGVSLLLDHLGLPASALMAVGDGGNDLQMVAGAGLGVAMGNAVPAVKAAAGAVVAGHNDGGVAEAFERFVL